MKTKKFSKKLSLQKTTVANLEKNDMSAALGGVKTYPYCLTVTLGCCITLKETCTTC